MRKVACVMVICVMLAGCATYSLPGGATDEAKRAAACLDARTGMQMAEAALKVVGPEATGEYLMYWNLFMIGAQTAYNAYCVPAAVTK